jgi:tetratricopeptide (TPR) repeat protein
VRAALVFRLAAFGVLLAIAVTWFVGRGGPESTAGAPPTLCPAPDHVGRTVCAGCHGEEHLAWIGSHHDRAMQEVGEAGALGDFSGATLVHGGTYRFSRDRGGRPQVEIASGDESSLHPVRFLFGATPLAQVLLDGPRGRLQSLPIAWATAEAAGGARWFPLHPDEPTLPGDPFHWTGLLHNWNHQCAECHSTALEKGYDARTDSYATSWAEIDVSCEACHGPGAEHVRWATGGGTTQGGEFGEAKGFPLRLRRDPDARWVRAEGEPTAHREPPLADRPELDACGRCHSRRTALADRVLPGRSLHDTHRLELLSEELYFPDGQIRDEVFELGSFLQSKMHAAGVTCSDCHDSHSGAVHVDGNGLCGGCHDPATFDGPAHHHHTPESPGAACVECHMPSRTYMGVDPRRDHSFRVPRPDLSVSLAVPNACTGCHAKEDAAWAAAAVREWFPAGRSGTPHFSEAFWAARGGAAEGTAALLAVAEDSTIAAIVRATALAELAGSIDLAHLDTVTRALGDEGEPLLRRSALASAEALPPRILIPMALPLLDDPFATVRWEAARVLAPHRAAIEDPTSRERLDRRIEEMRAALRTGEDRPEYCANLGNLALSLGETAEAERCYRRAIALEPAYGPAAANLADLLRSVGRDPEGIAVLEAAIGASPRDPGLRHALGLARVRAGDLPAAIVDLRRAAELDPLDPRHAAILAIALHDSGEIGAARETLRRALEVRPADAGLQTLLDAYERD